MLLVAVHASGCIQSGEKEETLRLIGLEKLDANEELNIVNWTVQGNTGKPPKPSSVDWDLISEPGNTAWHGIAIEYTGLPGSTGVYHIDFNQNDKIDVGDTFCVKAPENGSFTLRWFLDGNTGEYMAYY